MANHHSTSHTRMNLLWCLILLFDLSLYSVNAKESSQILELNSKNFNGYVDGTNNILVAFIAPWCGHCSMLKLSFEKLAEHFESQPLNFDINGYPKVSIGIVDATVELELADKYEVNGYPTIRFFPKNINTGNVMNNNNNIKFSEVYNGLRDVSSMSEWIINKSEDLDIKIFPKYIDVIKSNVISLSSSNFDAVVYDPINTVLVMFYAPWCIHCEKFKLNYDKLSNIFKDEEDVIIASVNADDEKELSNRFDVHMITPLS